MRDRERQGVSGGGAERERERETENLKLAAGPRLQAICTEPDVGLELTYCETMT